ncbi:MAG: hypothetical protein ACOYUZ_04350 [Patescibacteria group bacterium]
MKDLTIFFALGLLFSVWFTILTPADRFADPDAFYHITMARLITEHGPVTQFPWLDMTTLGDHFADQHFLFHVLQIPFLYFLDPLTAARISSIVFAVICMLGISFVFYKLRVKLFWLWPILLAFSQPFCTRLIQGKASPLAILFYLLGLSIVLIHLPDSRFQIPDSKLRLVLIFFVSLFYSLSHGGWILLPISILTLLLTDLVYAKFICKTAKFQILNSKFFCLIASLSGIAIGLAIHPGRNDLLSLLWIQIAQIAIATPRILRLGAEWNSVWGGDIIGLFAVFLPILLLALVGFFLSPDFRRIDVSTSDAKYQIRLPPEASAKEGNTKYDLRILSSLGLLLVILFAASVKNIRFAEYFQPVLALWVALLASQVDWKKYIKLFQTSATIIGRSWLPALIVFCVFILIPLNITRAYSSMHFSKRFLNDQYQIPLQAISAIAEPGARIYHSMWDEFPILFYQNQNFKYVSGLDPTFLYKKDSDLALDYQDLVFNRASSTQDEAWSLIHDRITADFVIIDHERWPDLNNLIASDPRYLNLASGNGATAYQVLE